MLLQRRFERAAFLNSQNMTVLTNSTGPLYSGWQEVEMTDQQFEVWRQDCCISEIEANRHLFSEEEYERLTKES